MEHITQKNSMQSTLRLTRASTTYDESAIPHHLRRGGGPGQAKMYHSKGARCTTDGRCTLIHDDIEMTRTGSRCSTCITL
eukprot:16257-Heterococcus_DN1.PRE.2